MSDTVATTRPGQFGIYKKSAAAQVSLLLPTYNPEKGYMERSGAVMIEATKSTGTDSDGNPQYDWDKKVKITFSLSMNDLALLFGNIESRLVHEYQGAVKGLQIKPGVDKYEGTYQLMLNQKDADGSTRQVMVPLTGGEMQVFSRLLDTATAKLVGW